MSWAIAALSASGLLLSDAASLAQRGEQVHCVRERAHVLRYDVAGEENDGSSLDGIERAIVSLEPSPAHAEHCRDKFESPNATSQENSCCTCVSNAGGMACSERCESQSNECQDCVRNGGGMGCINDGRCSCSTPTAAGKKQFCYGTNQDSTCAAAATELPINDYFSCKDCFASISADAFYWLDYSNLKLNRLQVGLNNSHLRASASLHTLLQGQSTIADGSIPVFGNSMFTVVDTLVGCPVCVKVKIEVGAPTSIQYNLKVSGEVDLQAGLALDVDLGDNFVTYDSEAGWSHLTHDPVVTATPLLTATANFQGDFDFGLTTQVQVNIDDIFWYHLTLNPSIPGTLSFSGDATVPRGELCLDATAKFSMIQEADLNWNLVLWKAVDHWGPSTLWSWQLPSALHSCKRFGALTLPSSSVVAV